MGAALTQKNTAMRLIIWAFAYGQLDRNYGVEHITTEEDVVRGVRRNRKKLAVIRHWLKQVLLNTDVNTLSWERIFLKRTFLTSHKERYCSRCSGGII